MDKKIIQLVLASLKEKELLCDEGVGYGDFPFTRDEFLDMWDYLAGYDENYNGIDVTIEDEKLVFIEYDKFQFVLREIACGQIINQMIIPNVNLLWEDDKKVCINE